MTTPVRNTLRVSPMPDTPTPAPAFGRALRDEQPVGATRAPTRVPAGPPSNEQESGSPVGAMVRGRLQAMAESDRAMQDAMEAVANGPLDRQELLEVQATVYAYSQQTDVATRVVDRSAGALRQLLNTQL